MKKLFLIFMLACMALSAFAFDDSVLLQSTMRLEGEEEFLQRLEAVKSEREPLGLVLSGGSARAYAHIGVLREMEKADIKPDFIVANSMGAIIGLLYASGISADDIEYLVTQVDLNSFFDMIVPLHGGLLNSRYFDEVLSRLFPDRYFDIKDSVIPILIPTEDLYTKRQIVFATGEITDVMRASFAMSAMMEPVDMTLSDGTKVRLVDSGAVDLGSISVAERYSTNLIISTALYTPQLNFNNPITVLNRTFSIGKERILINDLLTKDYQWLRNDVEHFSFMDFANVTDIVEHGADSARMFFARRIRIPCDSFTEYKENHPEFEEVRQLRHQYINDFCEDLKRGGKPVSENPFFGLKLRPSIPAIDTPDFFFNEDVSVGLFGLFDYKSVFARTGISSTFSSVWKEDTFVKFSFPKFVNFTGFASFALDLNDTSSCGFVAASEIDRKIYFAPMFSLHPYITAELKGELGKTASTDKVLFRGGLEMFSSKGDKLSYSFNPYAYIMADDFSSLSLDFGYGANAFADITAIPFVGLKVSDSIRYHENNQGIELFKVEGYRGKANPDYSSSKYLNLVSGELFWYAKSTKITAAELFKLEKAKIGAFCDFVSTENDTSICAGAFTRLQVSVSGLSIINMEFNAGYDVKGNSPVLGFTFTQNW